MKLSESRLVPGEESHTSNLKLYQVWPSLTTFKCHGFCIGPPNSQSFIVVTSLIILFSLTSFHQFGLCLYYYTNNSTDVHNEYTTGYTLSIVSLISELTTILLFLIASSSNPGILPRRYPTNDISLLKEYGIDPPPQSQDDDPYFYKLPNDTN